MIAAVVDILYKGRIKFNTRGVKNHEICIYFKVSEN